MRYISILLVAALLLMGCQASQFVSNLDRVVSTASAVLPVLSATSNLSPETTRQILAYLALVHQASVQAALILASNDTLIVKNLKVAAAFASIANGCNCLPAGTPQNVLVVVQGVVAAVQLFLANFSSPSPSPGAPGVIPPANIKVTGIDRGRLKTIGDKAQAELLKVHSFHK